MIEPAAGVLLISDPFLKDPNFMRTVVLLCEHNHEGSFGLVLNRDFEHGLHELINGLEEYPIPVYYGGPVQMDILHFLHQLPDQIPGGHPVAENIYWGGDFNTVVELIKEQRLDTARIRFYLGYSGWSSGQLAGELEEKSWLTVQATTPVVFHEEPGAIWKEALKQMGGEYAQLIHYPIDPQLN